MSDAIWLDACWAGPGFFTPPIPFDPTDRGLLLADGAFDTALVLGHRMVWRERHVGRLVAACAALGFVLDPVRVERAIETLLPRVEHGSLRITVTRGPAPRGVAPPAQVRPTLLATSAPLRAGTLFAPLRLHTTSIRRNELSPTSRIKGLSYADAALAAAEAKLAGADDALFLNTRGAVACTAMANLFAVLDGALLTPPLDEGVLDGVTRRALLAAAPAAGLAAREGSLDLADLHRAAAVLATNSLRLLSPVAAIDGRPLPVTGPAAALAAALADAVATDCGTDPRSLVRPGRPTPVDLSLAL